MTNSYVNKLYKSLKLISHYKKFPSMRPYIGPKYSSKFHSKLLLIGESFYFPEKSKIHLSPDKWYSSNEHDHSIEKNIDWIHCRHLLENEWRPNSGHKIYIELNNCFRLLKLDKEERALKHIAFMNCFQRPAIKGESFKYNWTEKDNNISIQTIEEVIKVIKPKIVIFVSKYAWDQCGQLLMDKYKNILFDFVYHPATQRFYWNNPHKSRKYGRLKFMRILNNKFIKHAK